jgi:hypothetical protein
MTDPQYTWREKALLTQQHEVESLLAEALGYPHDDQYGWVTGDHTIVTLAMEVRRRGILPQAPPPPPAPMAPTAAAPPSPDDRRDAGPARDTAAAAAAGSNGAEVAGQPPSRLPLD